jgi:hypothetical protein
MEEHKSPSDRPIWAYGYEITPPLPVDRLRAIEGLVSEEQAHAKLARRTWQGRLVVDEQVTHILVLSDTADQDLSVNRRLEAELKRLDAGFLVTPAVVFAGPNSWE